MSRIGIFMADGCEEIEGLAVVDIVRRANMDITMISINGKKEVTGSHNVVFLADTLAAEVDFADETVNQVIKKFAAEGKLVCAICAAPSVLGAAGILRGKEATCYPGFEDKLTGASVSEDAVVTDGNIITGRGMGAAIPFALEIVRYLQGEEAAETIRSGIVYQGV